MSDKHIYDFDKALSNLVKGENNNIYEIGCVSPVAVRNINENILELSWYPNTYTRFHEVSITLPKDKVRVCVGCWQYDINPYIFVEHEWLEKIHLIQYSIFALIDAIGVKNALKNNVLSKSKLLEIRSKLDSLAEEYQDVSFISFADTLLLKSNWMTGYFDKGIKDSYNPEIFLEIIKKVERIYLEALGLNIYAILTQGSNEYYGESLLHISPTNNHICLNSLGIPFAELKAIEDAVRKALREKIHPPAQVYMEEQFYHSLNFDYRYEKNKKPKNSYTAIMKSHKSNYYYASCDTLLQNLKK